MASVKGFFQKHLNWEILALGAGLNACLGIIGLVPITIGVLVEGYGFSLKSAGLFASMEIIAMSVTALLVTQLIGRFKNSSLAIVGGLIIAAGNGVVAMVTENVAIAAGLIVAGIGLGFVSAAVNASAASTEEPESSYASAMLVYAVGGSVIFAILPSLYVEIGYPLYFVGLGVVNAVMVLLYAKLNDSEQTDVKEKESASGSLLKDTKALSLFGSTLLVWTAMGLMWAVTERIAVSIGMSSQEAAYALLASNVFGMVGGFLVKLTGERFGRTLPLALGAVVLGVSFVGIGNAGTATLFSSALLVYGVAYFYLLPYIMGAAAELDSDGKVAAFNAAMPGISAAITPALGAYLSSAYSFGIAGNTAFVFAVLAGLLILPCSLYLDRRGKAEPDSTKTEACASA
jgi:predicted MFS family arabinose efflux permease